MGTQAAVMRAPAPEAKQGERASHAAMRPSERTPLGVSASRAPSSFAAVPMFAPGEDARAGSSAFSRIALQRKLAVGAVDDPLEREADRVADKLMRTPHPAAAVTASGAPVLRRKCSCQGSGEHCAACSAKQEEVLQRKATNAAMPTEVPPIIHEVLRSPGQPLDPAMRAFFEPRLGYDLSRVRVHSSSAAQQSARDVNAQAYTVGHNMVFGAGKYAPETNEGRRLLAHELAHVVQQSAQGSARINRPSIAAPDGNSERESKRAAESASSNQPSPIYHRSPQGIVQRQMCADILNAQEVRGVTRGVEVERRIRVDLITQLGAQNVIGLLAIPGASSRLRRMEDCGGFQSTQPAGTGFPDLAYRNGRNVELAEVKIGTWPCMVLAEQQVDNYVAVANGNEAFKQGHGVDEFELMPTSRFTPSPFRAPDGTPVNVGWCSPGVIVYKAVPSGGKEALYCGVSDKGRIDDFLNRLLDPAEQLVARALRRRLEELGLGPVNFRLLLAEVRKRIQEHTRQFLAKLIDTLCKHSVEITLAAVLAELARQLSMKDVADGFLKRFNRPGELLTT